MNKRHAPRLSLFLLGSPRIELDGQPIAVDTRKAIALLAYLAITRQPHSREALAALLWPEYDQGHAFAALRRTLSALNKAIGGAGLEIERETIGLSAGATLQIDVGDFQQRLAECLSHGHPRPAVCARCRAPLTTAAELYCGDFLAGFSLRDSAAFDDWQFFQAENLRREFLSVVDRLVRLHEEHGEFDTAIGYARRYLSSDPLHEPAQRELMKLYALSGQRAAALRQYQECVRVLKQELDVEPLAETMQLAEAIKANKLKAAMSLHQAAIDHRPSTIRHPYPLVGRALELETLLKTHLHSGEGRFVTIEGEAGIGKTRLVEEFIDRVRDRSGAIITACCYEGEAILPYGLFVEVLRAALASPDRLRQLERLPAVWLSEAARLAPELTSQHAAQPLDTPGAQGRFLEGVTQVLLALCTGSDRAPTILFLDDLNWIDEASLDLLLYFARRLRSHGLFIIAAWRTDNVPDDHRLRKLAADMQRSGLGERLTLALLNQAEVAELAHVILPDTAAAERLYRETDGLPYFVVEYLETLRAQAGRDWSTPRSVRHVLLARLADVSDAGRQLLQTAAVIGRSFDLDTLRAASGRSDEEAIVALEDLIGRRLIRESAARDVTQPPQYDFIHEKMREVIYEDASLARRRLLHQRVAQALVARQRSLHADALAGQIAVHYQLAGRREEAAEYFYRAGEHARSLYAHAEALAHYQAALASGYAEAALVQERLGDLHVLRGEYRAALQCYETASALDCGDVERLARLEHKSGQVHQRQGQREAAETHYAAASRTLSEKGSAGLQAQIYTDWSLTVQHRGEAGRALELAQQALVLAEAAADRRVLAQAHNVLGVLARHRSDSAAAKHHLQQSLAIAAESHDPIAHVAALNNLALVCGDGADVAEAIRLTEQALAECAALGDRHREAALHNNLADLMHEAGAPQEAMQHLKQAVTIFAEIGLESGTLQPEIWKLAEW